MYKYEGECHLENDKIMHTFPTELGLSGAPII